jgi:oligopeptide transport system ATP-binding protein
MSEALLRVVDLQVDYPVRRGAWRRQRLLHAVAQVGLEVRAGEALGVVGESGCGKSTLARAVLDLVRPAAGRILWQGRDVAELSRAERQRLRRDLQIIFQSPLASLDPRMSIVESIGEPLRVHRADLDECARANAVHESLQQMGLDASLAQRYPHELSGGQAQRAAIARAMILEPKLLVCDEAVSALDATIQAQIVELLRAVKDKRAVALLFISHNLGVVRELCDRVLVLYLGRMMEMAAVALLYAHPLHPYTRGLIEAIPVPDPDIQPARLTHVMPGEPPSAMQPPPGCVFHTRCPYVVPRCRSEIPAWEAVGDGRYVACHRWREI